MMNSFLDKIYFSKTNLPENQSTCPSYTLSSNTPHSTANREEPLDKESYSPGEKSEILLSVLRPLENQNFSYEIEVKLDGVLNRVDKTDDLMFRAVSPKLSIGEHFWAASLYVLDNTEATRWRAMISSKNKELHKIEQELERETDSEQIEFLLKKKEKILQDIQFAKQKILDARSQVVTGISDGFEVHP